MQQAGKPFTKEEQRQRLRKETGDDVEGIWTGWWVAHEAERKGTSVGRRWRMLSERDRKLTPMSALSKQKRGARL